MDLIEVRDVRVPSTRDEIWFAPGERPLGGGTWLYSEAQPGVTGLVDLTRLDWTPIEWTDAGLTVSATCTIADLAALTPVELRTDPFLAGAPTETHDPRALFWQCANSLLASFKIWNVATVGGNICTALPAGPMTSLGSALDALAVIWGPESSVRRMPVADFVHGVQHNDLRSGEILRAIEFPAAALAGRTAFRRIALSPLGRSGTLVIARVDPSGEAVFTVTAGTTRPHVLRFGSLPTPAALEAAVDAIDDWYSDPHGAPDWRHAMSRLFALQLLDELS